MNLSTMYPPLLFTTSYQRSINCSMLQGLKSLRFDSKNSSSHNLSTKKLLNETPLKFIKEAIAKGWEFERAKWGRYSRRGSLISRLIMLATLGRTLSCWIITLYRRSGLFSWIASSSQFICSTYNLALADWSFHLRTQHRWLEQLWQFYEQTRIWHRFAFHRKAVYNLI